MRISTYLILAVMAGAVSCFNPYQEQEPAPSGGGGGKKTSAGVSVTALLSETFESGTKTAYTTGDVVLSTGTWTFTDALIGNSTTDAKTGTKSARVRNGKIGMKFDKTGGIGTVTVSHAAFGSDIPGTWQLWYSTNAGSTYTQSGGTITSTGNVLATATFTVNVGGNARIELRRTGGGTNRVNFDNISITDYTTTTTNPAPALTSISPTSANAGASALTLTVNGSNFVNTSVVNWNGSALTTTYVTPTQLTASVAATRLANAGTASVTVVSPAPGGGTTTTATFTINSVVVPTGKKFLFDNTKAEMAGNADWVIDQDGSVPARFPTPAQSGITATTAETYWQGAISAWGIALVKRGHTVETLPSSGSITYGNASNPQDLSNYNVFVVDEPNILFTAAQKTAILQFVQNGGGLVMISDHTASDRNNDGWDSPAIWNDFFTNNSVQANPFGMSMTLNNFSGVSSNKSTVSHPILNGVAGTVAQLEFNAGASLTINTTANPNVKGHIWRSGYTQNTSNVLCASSTFGTGRVFILGDSSPTDDGTGGPGNTLYNGWGVYSHATLLTNASLWVAKVQ